MAIEIKPGQILFAIDWEGADRKIYLLRDDFYGHVVEHTEINSGKIGLIETTIKTAIAKNELYQWVTSPISDFFIQQKCVDFLPGNDYLRVALRKLDEQTFKVTSAYAVFGMTQKGIRRYDPSI